jgi:hypothetical protein
VSINGYRIVARSSRSLLELSSVRRSAGNRIMVIGYQRDGDWQTIEYNAREIEPADLVAETGAPALVLFVV